MILQRGRWCYKRVVVLQADGGATSQGGGVLGGASIGERWRCKEVEPMLQGWGGAVAYRG
jgi:hypothetical protein